MLTKDEIGKILVEACSPGADFAELYFEDTTVSNVRIIQDKVDESSATNLYGCGLRVLKDMEEAYGYTNDTSFDGLWQLAQNLKQNYHSKPLISAVSFQEQQRTDHTTFGSLAVDYDQLCATLKQIAKTILAYDSRMIQAAATYQGQLQKITVCNTNGVFANDTRFIQRIAAQAVSKDENSMQSGFDSYGGNFDFKALMDYDYDEFAKKIAQTAITMLTAKEMKGGVYDVVIHNAFGGVIFHEACGHSLEATSVAKKLSVFSDKLGEKIASDVVTAIDDGTIANEWGSQNIDDEGNPQQKRVLIENGILKSYMIDMRNARRMKMPSTGSGRRQSYRFSPTSRMSNTYIANGSSTFEEIIQNTKYGLFAKSMGGGSVNPATGEYNFSVSEGYLIEDGKITEPVRGATLIGNGKDTLLKIDMVADNLSLGYGMCGSLSGSIPACVGQPTIRVKAMTVGGKGE